mmetsp:Transcript_27333/g.59781  ORF Transcript_27333/g.59781 Transcript_27333/m.59781 type:complete len:83 (-) Transcript_27333:1747-1995(-)
MVVRQPLRADLCFVHMLLLHVEQLRPRAAEHTSFGPGPHLQQAPDMGLLAAAEPNVVADQALPWVADLEPSSAWGRQKHLGV